MNLALEQVRGTRAFLNALNPVLEDGQLAIETDTEVHTVGDGSSRYLDIRGNTKLSPAERRSADDVRTAHDLTHDGRRYLKLLVTQTGTGVPTETILENTLNFGHSWGREGVGQYRITFEETVNLAKVGVMMTPDTPNNYFTIDRSAGDGEFFLLYSFDREGSYQDAALNAHYLEITIYP